MANQNFNESFDFNLLFEEVASTKKIEKEIVLELFKESIKEVIAKYDPDANVTIDIDQDEKNIWINKEFIVYSDEEFSDLFLTLKEDDIEKIANELTFIKLSEAKKISQESEIDDLVVKTFEIKSLHGKVQNAIISQFRQALSKKVKENIYANFKDKIGTIVKVKITTKGKQGFNALIIKDETPAFLPLRFANKKLIENHDNITEIDAFIENVLEDTKHSQIILSTSSNELLKIELANEIPELAQGLIKIVNISRVAGERAKVAIAKAEGVTFNFDEIGSIIGRDGSRISAVSAKLGGELIDIIKYDENFLKYIANAFSPSRVVSIVYNQKLSSFDVIVPNSQLSLAIGKKGINVSLIADLLKIKINVLSFAQAIEQNMRFQYNGNIQGEELEELNQVYNPNMRRNSFMPRFQRSENTYRPRDFTADKDLQLILSEMNEYKTQIEDEEDKVETKSTTDFVKKAVKLKDNNFDFNVKQEDLDKIIESKDDEDLVVIEQQMKDYTADKDLVDTLGDFDFDDIDDEDWE
ncbi:NusA N-terminal domain-containing protein [Mycoplasma phocimorsus]|uniref:NusA N-terminal domain-containing protein n=1 Tax=Mycoplasma phocimorsus TaxID=3045839 RepID=A0AAJ1PSR6_9MOLU|nr:NusA N-terminal domain-containing protein [Mycoplasma phocimorsus]MDJ1645866.1 NusA N-terminal domain-containing protein [Mycoplasma phocimorsus]MDJ1646408.1 NusA N-terminal domain-containing protein [Mycoplasma phocimorsus]MDJ1647033.1 NusA N-terminal domain-containing protein [Mycoplasma phocimorsus]MDJ1647474.1 NusA N-terminal domain-containing protein [Mycoplasma phocimorsus]MDJ1647988.1 NusA N-terminal domain-containing protein [Mycoplasma phocimorsus]